MTILFKRMTRATRWILIIVIGVGAAAAAAGVLLIAGRGFSAREEPTAVEAFAARRLRSLAMPRAARNERNPVAPLPEVLSEAMAHFADHCAFCHGNDGSGDTPIGRGLYPKAPDMRRAETQNLTDGEIYYIIQNGIRLTGMPAFGQDTAGPDLDSWKLVHFIRHLPNITVEEVQQMKSMNPKSPQEWLEEEAMRRFLEGDDSQPALPNHQHH